MKYFPVVLILTTSLVAAPTKKAVKHTIQPDNTIGHKVVNVTIKPKVRNLQPVKITQEPPVAPTPVVKNESPVKINNQIYNNGIPKTEESKETDVSSSLKPIQIDNKIYNVIEPKKEEPKPEPKKEEPKPEPKKVSFGLLGGLSTPIGALYSEENCGTNKRLGYHLGGFVDFNLTTHHQLRTSLSYSKLPGSSWDHEYNVIKHHHLFEVAKSYTNTYTLKQLGADWVYNFDTSIIGWYSILGLNYFQFKNDGEYIKSINDHIVCEETYTDKQSLLAFKGGVGYNFNPTISLESTYNQGSVSKNTFGFNKAKWLQTSLVIHL
jgi:hypothetical protein